jgi:uncharacterized protein
MDAMWKYVINSYVLFWTIILVLGGAASMLFDAPDGVMVGITILGSWSPTIVLLLMLGRLRPGMSIADFYRNAFRPRLDGKLLTAIPAIVFGAFLAAIWLTSVIEGTTFTSQIALPSAVGLAIVITVFQGPSGEESGWRGYLRPELEDRFGFVKGNLVLGLVWAFWHAPLWFVASDYVGIQSAIYILANIVVLTALTVFMSTSMKRCNNLFVAFWIHFCFNVSLGFFAGGIYFFAVFSVIYVAVALASLRVYQRTIPTMARA